MNGVPEILPTLPKVGYWFSNKKARKFKITDFDQICRRHGLELVKIDLERSLEEQGPFVAIVHKLSEIIVKADHGDVHSQAICAAFEDYISSHPDVVIIDPLPNVAQLHNRYTQYKIIEDSELQKSGEVFVPAFVELTTSDVSENVAKMKAANVTFPCVCKPSLAHGSSFVHQMCLVFNEEGLKDITLPCIAQTFVNHNAILFKLFIIGSKYFVIERPSLKNFYAGDYKTIFFDSHSISKPNSASVLNELDESEPKTPAICPEEAKLDHIVAVLCQHVKLVLFGIDIVIDNKTGHYAIVDMNVFPGYDGIENFFELVTDFIVTKITSQVTGANSSSKPMLLNEKWTPLKHTTWEKSSLGSISNSEKDQTVAVIPSNSHCFCCPISGQCHNMCRSNGEEIARDAIKKLDMSVELSSLLHDANLRNDKEICGIVTNNGDKVFSSPDSMHENKILSSPDSMHENKIFSSPDSMQENKVFGSPDSMQEDSGIETSDSCDEKKKGSIPKNVKRQHSRSHPNTTTIEESH